MTRETNRKLLVEYAELKLKEKDIAEKIKIMKDAVLAEVLNFLDGEDRPMELKGYGQILIINKPVWKYTDKVRQLETMMKEQKTKEEAEGDATCEYNTYPMFKPNLEE